MHELVRATFAALEDADLTELIEEIRDRLFAREADGLLDVTVEPGLCQWSFKPMVELLLRHVLYLATHRTLSLGDRRLEILDALELAGF